MSVVSRVVANKELARTQQITCSQCKTKQSYIISRERTWITVLKIPAFIVATNYSYHCPACKNSYPLVKQQVKYMIKRADSQV